LSVRLCTCIHASMYPCVFMYYPRLHYFICVIVVFDQRKLCHVIMFDKCVDESLFCVTVASACIIHNTCIHIHTSRHTYTHTHTNQTQVHRYTYKLMRAPHTHRHTYGRKYTHVSITNTGNNVGHTPFKELGTQKLQCTLDPASHLV